MSTLFNAAGLADGTPHPLADRLRPKELDDVLGQDHVLGQGGPLQRMLDSGRLSSLVFWGPPGTGKTTIARLLADRVGLDFVQLSAVFSGVADLRKAIDGARQRRQVGRGTILFVDEIHRFNRTQQDGFLPVVEDGTIILVGATTENPSFELNAALLSRCQILVLNRLEDADLERLLERAEVSMRRKLPLNSDARVVLRGMSDGDGRYLLNLAEDLFAAGDESLNTEALVKAVQKRAPIYDKSRGEHYNLISALHKSLRGSDTNASLYWLARMLVGGESPLYIVRRLVRFATEDVGLADPEAVHQALAAKDTYDFLGSPEGELAIAQAVIYLATAPKSNATYAAFSQATQSARETGSLSPPKHILNAPTSLMRGLGYGKGYAYDHNSADSFSGHNYFPDEMNRTEFYAPTEHGFEREVGKRLAYWLKLRESGRGRVE